MIPTLSIVTPSLNDVAHVAEAISSVRLKSGGRVQHIVVDGGSTDGTLDVLAKFPIERHVMPRLDSHQAINYGAARAVGDVVGVLNTDDYYQPGALDAVLAFWADHLEAEAICGSMRFFHGGGEEWKRGHVRDDGMMLELTFGAPAFNTWFFRLSSWQRLGGLDTRWSFSADRDFLLRLFRTTRPAVLNRLVYHYRVHGGSRTLRPDGANRPAIAAEHLALAQAQLAVPGWGPAQVRTLRSWWAYEWLKHKVLGGVPDRRPNRLPPLLSLPRAFLLRRRLQQALP